MERRLYTIQGRRCVGETEKILAEEAQVKQVRPFGIEDGRESYLVVYNAYSVQYFVIRTSLQAVDPGKVRDTNKVE